MSNNTNQASASSINGRKYNPNTISHQKDTGTTAKKPIKPETASPRSIEDELAKLRTAAAVIQQIRLSAQRELELARRMRAEAQRYQQETETRARSEAQQLILKARLATQKEIEELIRNAGAEIQKVLADIRVIRITAQEELAAQRKFTDAARIGTISHEVIKDTPEPDIKRQKQLVSNN